LRPQIEPLEPRLLLDGALLGDRTDIPVGNNPFWIVAQDFNGDSLPDLAVTNSSDADVSILYGQPDGGFGGREDVDVAGNTYDIVSEDFNGDGIPDFAVTRPLQGYVTIVYGQPSGGFGSHQHVNVGGEPLGIVTADFWGRKTGRLKPEIVGLAKPLLVVTVYDGLAELAQTTAAADGGFSFVPSEDLAVGVHAINATQADDAGNISDYSEQFSLRIVAAGDANEDEDGKVDGEDLAAWQRNYDPIGNPANTWAMGDWNGDTKIDGGDLALWQRNYDPLGSSVNGADGLAPMGQEGFDTAVADASGESSGELLLTESNDVARALPLDMLLRRARLRLEEHLAVAPLRPSAASPNAELREPLSTREPQVAVARRGGSGRMMVSKTDSHPVDILQLAVLDAAFVV
jgi:hypothetical protein